MNRGRPALALAGLGAGLFFSALYRLLAVLLWPKAGGALFLVSLLGAPAGAAAVYVFSGEGSGRKGPSPWPSLAWGVAVLAVLIFPGALATLSPGGGISVAAAVFAAAPAFCLAAALLTGGPGSFPRGGGVFVAALGAGAFAGALLAGLHPAVPALAGLFLGTVPALLSGPFAPRALGAAVLIGAGIFAFSGRPLEGVAPGSAAGQGWETVEASWCGTAEVTREREDGGAEMILVSGGLRGGIAPSGAGSAPAILIAEPADGSVDLLSVGYPAGDYLDLFFDLRARRGGKGATLTILEALPAVPSMAETIRPELARAREEGAITVVAGNPRWFLRRSPRRFERVVISAAPSPRAYIEGALAFDEDYVDTVEAFRDASAMLEPGGTLHVRRAGTARAVTTLREAAGGPGRGSFADEVIVLGNKGELVSECWYRPGGFDGSELEEVNRHSVERGVAVLYSPQTRRRWNLYFRLVRDEKVPGLYFTSPQDLSPGRDSRPFFEHFERLSISPHGAPVPEERGRLGGEWSVTPIPPGDRIRWQVVLAALLLAPPLLLLPLGLYHHRTGLSGHALAGLAPLFLLGLASATALRSLSALAGPMDPFPLRTGWPAALFLAAAGGGWGAAGAWGWRKWAALLAALLFAAGAAGYPASALLAGAGPLPWTLATAALTGLAGFAAGAAASACLAGCAGAFPGAEPLLAAFILFGACAAIGASALPAVAFGFPMLSMTAAAAALAALRAGRDL